MLKTRIKSIQKQYDMIFQKMEKELLEIKEECWEKDCEIEELKQQLEKLKLN